MINNWSFEDTVSCPTILTQINKAVGWMSFSITPDYFNACAIDSPTTGTPVTVPNNYWGIQNAHTGNAYAAFVAFNGTGAREFVATQLNQPMVIGQKYFLSYWVSTAYGYSNNYPVMACNHLGVKFSSVAYSQLNPQAVNNFAHIVDTNIINDTINWVKIAGSFISDSLYQYISIGNFYDNLHTSYVSLGTNLNDAIYYLDDVRLSTDSAFVNGINEQNNVFQITLSPNPFNDLLVITTKRKELLEFVLYDMTGRKTLCLSIINSTSINTERLTKGIYLYELRDKNGVITKGKVVKD